MIQVIGCGGVASYLVPALVKVAPPESIMLIDGDILEPRNLDRQLFEPNDIGRNKAEALGQRYGTQYEPNWFSYGQSELFGDDLLILCVDNHAARSEALDCCDHFGCRAIMAANETHSAEAYYYQRDWKKTSLDPRVYYPELASDRTGDPRRRTAGCTGEALRGNPQLATANFMAAALALQLYVVWVMELPKLAKEARPHLPHKLVSNLTRLESFKAQTKAQTV